VGEIRVDEVPCGLDLSNRLQERHESLGIVPPDSDMEAIIWSPFDSRQRPLVEVIQD
jgi:hypothetical protein